MERAQEQGHKGKVTRERGQEHKGKDTYRGMGKGKGTMAKEQGKRKWHKGEATRVKTLGLKGFFT